MDILKFSLKGRTGFFKKPEVNTYISFTYSNIHKVALLGILGAIRGYGGYNSWDMTGRKEYYPEFYQRLKDLQCSIVPTNEDGAVRKKIQQFNNSVGYASEEQGGNLIVKEQWLENPSWHIYIALDCDEAKKIAEDLAAHRCVYIPYLGKNDHIADIDEVSIIPNCVPVKDFIKIDSLCLKHKALYGDIDDYEDEYYGIREFRYEETLPVALNIDTMMYESKAFIHSNLPVESYEDEVYRLDKENFVFF